MTRRQPVTINHFQLNGAAQLSSPRTRSKIACQERTWSYRWVTLSWAIPWTCSASSVWKIWSREWWKTCSSSTSKCKEVRVHSALALWRIQPWWGLMGPFLQYLACFTEALWNPQLHSTSRKKSVRRTWIEWRLCLSGGSTWSSEIRWSCSRFAGTHWFISSSKSGTWTRDQCHLPWVGTRSGTYCSFRRGCHYSHSHSCKFD